jgi:catechol 2,3-dioxygenase-like lactoylglutathione lyase family enzyme
MLWARGDAVLSSCELIGIVPTLDKEKAKAFYCDVLGLEFVEDDGFALVLKAHHAAIRIVKMPEFKPFPFTLLGWEVSAIEDEVRALGAAGVTFERFGFFEQDELCIWTAPNGNKVAWFKDPDGNVLSVAQH